MKKSERNALILAPPGIVFTSLLLDLPHESAPLAIYLLRFYGLFLFLYIYWVLWIEYSRFFDKHRRKSPALDTMILCFAFLGIRNFCSDANPTSLTRSVWWLDLFLLSLCAWEVYTMALNTYLDTDGESWLSWFRLLAEPLFPYRIPTKTMHRDEYRYWLLLDGMLFVVITTTLISYPSLFDSKLGFVSWTIPIAGTIIGLANVFRYKVLIRRNSQQLAALENLSWPHPY